MDMWSDVWSDKRIDVYYRCVTKNFRERKFSKVSTEYA